MTDQELNELLWSYQSKMGIQHPAAMERNGSGYWMELEFPRESIDRVEVYQTAGFLMGVMLETVVVFELDDVYQLVFPGDSWL